MSLRGFFEIGVYRGKTEANIGTLWRSAYQLGAVGIFTIGKRYTHQASDTCKAYRNIPMREFVDWQQFNDNRPYDAILIGIETGGMPLYRFTHPLRAVYLLGAEDSGLPPDILAKCQCVVSLEALQAFSYNVAVAGSIVMYDRMQKEYRGSIV